MTEDSKAKLIQRVVKLFNLGDGGRNQSEAEVLAAVAKARDLMAEHAITEADLASARSEKARKIAIILKDRRAYVRAGRSFASYDGNVAIAVSRICDTFAVVRTRMIDGKWYVSQDFVGEEADVAVSVELFQLLLQTMRRWTRASCGSKWSNVHTAYAIGFGNKLAERAKSWKPKLLTDGQQQALVLISDAKKEAIEDWRKKNGIREGKQKKKSFSAKEAFAYAQGREDADGVDLGNPRRRLG